MSSFVKCCLLYEWLALERDRLGNMSTFKLESHANIWTFLYHHCLTAVWARACVRRPCWFTYKNVWFFVPVLDGNPVWARACVRWPLSAASLRSWRSAQGSGRISFFVFFSPRKFFSSSPVVIYIHISRYIHICIWACQLASLVSA